MKNRVYESLTTVFSVLGSAAFFISGLPRSDLSSAVPGPRAGSLLPVLQEKLPVMQLVMRLTILNPRPIPP